MIPGNPPRGFLPQPTSLPVAQRQPNSFGDAGCRLEENARDALGWAAGCPPLPTIKLVPSNPALHLLAQTRIVGRGGSQELHAGVRRMTQGQTGRDAVYTMGYTEDESRRLTDQGRLFASSTRALLLEAGIGP